MAYVVRIPFLGDEYLVSAPWAETLSSLVKVTVSLTTRGGRVLQIGRRIRVSILFMKKARRVDNRQSFADKGMIRVDRYSSKVIRPATVPEVAPRVLR